MQLVAGYGCAIAFGLCRVRAQVGKRAFVREGCLAGIEPAYDFGLAHLGGKVIPGALFNG